MYINFYLHFIYFYKKIKDKTYKKCYVYNIFKSNHSFFFFFFLRTQTKTARGEITIT